MDISVILLLICLRHSQGQENSKTCTVDPALNRVENAALQKPAKQISTFQYGNASNAVDGNTDSWFWSGSCMHTKNQQDLHQWWMVDLESEYQIHNVTITNRQTFAERQRDFDIFVSLNGTMDNDDHMTDASLCIHVNGRMGPEETRIITCEKPLYGQYVQIFMKTHDKRSMHVCEVTVQGYTAMCIEETTAQTSPVTTMSTPETDTTETALAVTHISTPVAIKPISMASSLPGNSTTRKPPTCPCVCTGASSNTTNLTREALTELVKQLAKELKVNKKETSQSRRKLISVGDQRQSAQTIGFIGVLALSVPVLFMVSFDLINLWSFASKKKNKVMPK